MKKFQITGRFFGSAESERAMFDPRNEEWVSESMDAEKFDIEPEDLEQMLFIAHQDEDVTNIRANEIEYEMEDE